jgi:hypothetical protein
MTENVLHTDEEMPPEESVVDLGVIPEGSQEATYITLAANCFYIDTIPVRRTDTMRGLLIQTCPAKAAAVYMAECLMGKNIPISEDLIDLLLGSQYISEFHQANNMKQ